MGYTHNWEGTITNTEWMVVKPIAQKIIELSDVPIEVRGDVSDDVLSLNGEGADSHECFVIMAGNQHDFCKTARKPYDEVVVAILIAADKYAEYFVWWSDGVEADHADGRALCEAAIKSLT